MRAIWIAATLAAMVPAAANAAGPQSADICQPNGAAKGQMVVNPEWLADYFLTADHVDLKFILAKSDALGAAGAANDKLGVATRLIMSQTCLTEDVQNSACKAYLDAKSELLGFVQRSASKRPDATYRYSGQATTISGIDSVSDIQMESFFKGEGPPIVCVVSTSGVADSKPGGLSGKSTGPSDDATEKFTFPFLVRGSPDGFNLADDNDRSSAAFKALPKATISNGWDGSSGKTTNKLVLFVGAAFDKKTIAPYVGVNQSLGIAKDKTKSYNTNTAEIGVSFAKTYTNDRKGDPNADLSPWQMSSWAVSIRPDYLSDFYNKNRVATADITVTPTIPTVLNVFKVVNPSNPVFYYAYTFELHQDNGWYVVRGPKAPKDFTRLGAKAGFVIQSANPNVPLTLTVNDTLIYGLRGTPRHFDDTYVDLAWSLDPKKYFAIEATYTNGRNEYTTDIDRTWTIGLTAKY